MNTNTLFGEDYVVHQVGYTNTDTSQSEDYGWSMKYVFTFAAAKAFSGKSILGKAYMAPWTSLHVMRGMELNVVDTILAFSFKSPKTLVRS